MERVNDLNIPEATENGHGKGEQLLLNVRLLLSGSEYWTEYTVVPIRVDLADIVVEPLKTRMFYFFMFYINVHVLTDWNRKSHIFGIYLKLK